MANDINKVFLVGRLTRDVELSYTPSNNTALANFAIASNESRGNNKQDEVHYFDIVVWGKLAEICNQYLGKGKQVVIDGKLRQRRYQDKQGQYRSSITIVADNVQFVGGNDSSRKKEEVDFSPQQKAQVNLDTSLDLSPSVDSSDIPF